MIHGLTGLQGFGFKPKLKANIGVRISVYTHSCCVNKLKFQIYPTIKFIVSTVQKSAKNILECLLSISLL